MNLPTQEMRKLALVVLNEPYDYGQPASDLACHVLALSDEAAKLRELLQDCDSLISLVRHRQNLDWGTRSLPKQWEVDQLIGAVRKAIGRE